MNIGKETGFMFALSEGTPITHFQYTAGKFLFDERRRNFIILVSPHMVGEHVGSIVLFRSPSRSNNHRFWNGDLYQGLMKCGSMNLGVHRVLWLSEELWRKYERKEKDHESWRY